MTKFFGIAELRDDSVNDKLLPLHPLPPLFALIHPTILQRQFF